MLPLLEVLRWMPKLVTLSLPHNGLTNVGLELLVHAVESQQAVGASKSGTATAAAPDNNTQKEEEEERLHRHNKAGLVYGCRWSKVLVLDLQGNEFSPLGGERLLKRLRLRMPHAELTA